MTIYVTLFLLSVTQSVCLLCDILFIFWSLKEEADVEIHQNMVEGKKFSTKLRLLSRFLPYCFSLPQVTDYTRARNTVALSEIHSVEEGDEEEGESEMGSGGTNSTQPTSPLATHPRQEIAEVTVWRGEPVLLDPAP